MEEAAVRKVNVNEGEEEVEGKSSLRWNGGGGGEK